VQAYESAKCGFIIVARKTARLVEQLKAAEWHLNNAQHTSTLATLSNETGDRGLLR
jgi:hypothetical protein